MLELFTMSAKSICFVLSAPLHELSTMQAAIRQALEERNTAEELEAIRKAACLEDSFSKFGVSSTGRASRL